MKIYTRTGDLGETGLYGGSRVRKDDLRVEAYGSIDELNAALGAAHGLLEHSAADVAGLLAVIQAELFDIGAELATPVEREGTELARRLHKVGVPHVDALERAIDSYEAQLPPLKSFILPGGTQAASALHRARTIARRAERRVVSLSSQQPVSPEILRYLNRLSDLMFVLARTVNRLAGVQEREWKA